MPPNSLQRLSSAREPAPQPTPDAEKPAAGATRSAGVGPWRTTHWSCSSQSTATLWTIALRLTALERPRSDHSIFTHNAPIEHLPAIGTSCAAE
jgi:hypothetical protein